MIYILENQWYQGNKLYGDHPYYLSLGNSNVSKQQQNNQVTAIFNTSIR